MELCNTALLKDIIIFVVMAVYVNTLSPININTLEPTTLPSILFIGIPLMLFGMSIALLIESLRLIMIVTRSQAQLEMVGNAIKFMSGSVSDSQEVKK